MKFIEIVMVFINWSSGTLQEVFKKKYIYTKFVSLEPDNINCCTYSKYIHSLIVLQCFVLSLNKSSPYKLYTICLTNSLFISLPFSLCISLSYTFYVVGCVYNGNQGSINKIRDPSCMQSWIFMSCSGVRFTARALDPVSDRRLILYHLPLLVPVL